MPCRQKDDKFVKRLLLMRHAKSDWDHPHLADADRPLNERGQRAAAAMGEWLQQQTAVPQLILVSPAVRAQETLARLLSQWINPPECRTVERLYPGSPQHFLWSVGQVDEATESVLLLAHNPGLEILVDMIGGRAEPFPTAAVADIRVGEVAWEAAANAAPRFVERCELEQIWRPRALFADKEREIG